MLPISIRPARRADRDAVLALTPRLEQFDLPSNAVPGEIAEGEARMLAQVFEQMPPGAALLVAEYRDRVVGFIFLETKVDYFTGTPHGHVGILAVAEDIEGNGVGTRLLLAADDWGVSLGYDRLTLFVFEANARARATYERAGFRADLVRYRRDLNRPSPLHTRHYVLVPASAEMVRADLSSGPALAAALDARVPEEWPPDVADTPALERAMSMLNDPANRDWAYYYITTRGEGRVVAGLIGYGGAPSDDGTLEVGHCLLPGFEGRGIEQEAWDALLHRGFATSGVARVACETPCGFVGVIALLESLGFERAGEGRDSGYVRFILSRERWMSGA